MEDGKSCGRVFVQSKADTYTKLYVVFASAKSDPEQGMESGNEENDVMCVHSAYQAGHQAGQSVSWCQPRHGYMTAWSGWCLHEHTLMSHVTRQCMQSS